MIANAAFQPQAAAFTSMLSMCAKNREWQKALEVFQAMRDFHPAVRPNTVHYSSLISACATVGRCEEAMQVSSCCLPWASSVVSQTHSSYHTRKSNACYLGDEHDNENLQQSFVAPCFVFLAELDLICGSSM